VERLFVRQPAQDVLDHVLVGVKLGDGAADVLFPGVAEQVEFGLVGPQDGPVGPHPVQADGGVFDKVGQFTLAPAQLFQSL
jgi:hypothetical protein